MQRAIESLKRKPPTQKGIRAEDLRRCDEETKQMLLDTFNIIIKPHTTPPGAWKRVLIKVIQRRVTQQHLKNDRPMCTLPALCKLFSTTLYNLLYSMLDSRHPIKVRFERLARRRTTVKTYRVLAQKAKNGAQSCGSQLSALSASKRHLAQYHMMRCAGQSNEQSTNEGYLDLLKRLCDSRSASVLTDVEQGDL